MNAINSINEIVVVEIDRNGLNNFLSYIRDREYWHSSRSPMSYIYPLVYIASLIKNT